MPIFNVKAKVEITMVVIADDANHAYTVAWDNFSDALNDADEDPDIDVTGEVSCIGHLRDGWDEQCVPYGGDRNTRLSELIGSNKP